MAYLSFTAINKSAPVLEQMRGCDLSNKDTDERLRVGLQKATGLPFKSGKNSVWRNYARVFETALVATTIGRKLETTDLNRLIAEEKVSADEYLRHVAKRFYLPSPVFKGYDPNVARIFPFSEMISMALCNLQSSGHASVLLDEVLGKSGNLHFTSSEVHCAQHAGAQHANITDQAIRQIREMMIFMTQHPAFSYSNAALHIDVDNYESPTLLYDDFRPIELVRLCTKGEEIILLGSGIVPSIVDVSRWLPKADELFHEGKKERKYHLKVERSSALIRKFFAEKGSNPLCDICLLDTHKRYPWADRVIELHHLLPLSSPIRADSSGTSLADLVPLCPTCHSAVHKFYRRWFNETGQRDFESFEQSKAVYGESKRRVRL